MREPVYSNLFMLRSLSSTFRDERPAGGRRPSEGPGTEPADRRRTTRWDVEVLLVVLFAAAAIVCEALYKGGV